LIVLLHTAQDAAKDDKDDIQGHRILRIPYTSVLGAGEADSNTSIPYHTIPATKNGKHLLPTGSAPTSSDRKITTITPTVVQQYTIHVFEKEARFTPSKLVVNGRKGRRVVVVLAEDGKHYRVLDLDYPSQREEEGETEVDVGEDAEGDTAMSGL
jgi:anaphase-promoting complex subunit 4